MSETFDLTQARQLAEECAARAEKATPGPWEVSDGEIIGHASVLGQVYGADDYPCLDEEMQSIADECMGNANLIAHARQDVPALSAALAAACDEVENLRDKNEELTAYYRNIMATSSHANEEHCTCVPALRREVDRLTAERDALREANRVAEAALLGMYWDRSEIEKAVANLQDDIGVAAAIAALRQARGEQDCACVPGLHKEGGPG